MESDQCISVLSEMRPETQNLRLMKRHITIKAFHRVQTLTDAWKREQLIDKQSAKRYFTKLCLGNSFQKCLYSSFIHFIYLYLNEMDLRL